MFKKYLTSVFILYGCILENAAAQNGINKITKLGNNYSVFTESAWYKDTLYVTGTSTTPEVRTGAIAKYLLDGTLFNFTFLIDTFIDFGFGFWDKGLLIEDDTIYHVAAKGYSGTLHNGSILKLDINGNILKEKEITSIYYPEDDFCRIKDFIKTDFGFYILDYARKTETDFQCCLIKTDIEFDINWRKCFGNNSLEIPKDLVITGNEQLITLANSTNLDISEQYIGPGNGYYRGYIFEVSSSGVLNWEWRSTSKMEAVYAGILENDSTLIVAGGAGKEYCSDSEPNALCFLTWTGKVFKLDLNTREKIWDSSLSGGAHTSMFDNRYLDIISSIDGDGYILCGAGYDTISNCRTDTIDKCWANPGVIAKISSSGDSLWLRKYFGVSDIFESNILYDAEITPESGYSFVGEAFNHWPGETQGQHGWLLMTDKYGCLVPGCQLISSIEESSEKNELLSSPMKIYPNPASNVINVLITTTLPGSATLHLINPFGQEVDKWHSFEKGATYIIPIDHLVPGIYFMVMTDGNAVISSQQVLVH